MHTLLRRSASALFHTPKPLYPTSVSQNLANRKQCLLALDGPGMPHDPFAYPVTWSKKNLLAVACGNDVYYQNINNRSIEHFGRLTAPMCGRLHAIEWAEHARTEGALAVASTTGVVQIWYAGSGIGGRAGRDVTIDGPFCGVGAMCWNKDVLAVGKNDGSIALFDDREGEMRTLKMSRHNGKIMGVKWSADGGYVASGDNHGRVFIWDSRAAKWLGDGGTKGPKMRHRGPVKVCTT
jgi:cell division cycle protein 20 (cofactor of APC complex)